ncbi:hypothetical protein LR48_Vigan02g182700 [Vigna angularis]|uniref:Uncharacterized protein n=1 Tax=Phaseolus angularis TaxID=3914 RepID=A0A0L9TZ47_PHAAN|nr:uncharacterized protein HKW66_Vig0191210 [Vigna angularis]KOM35677.1 hypothetical protein LR48_Vigan02g182700 [Vigna angularis]
MPNLDKLDMLDRHFRRLHVSSMVRQHSPPRSPPTGQARLRRRPLPLAAPESFPPSLEKTFSWAPNAPSASTTSPQTNPLDSFPVATTPSMWNALTPGSPSTLSALSAEPNSTPRFSLPRKILAETEQRVLS